jgi:hypothetical protein
MSLTAQDSTGRVSGANAYITVAEFKAYHAARSQSYGAATDPDIDAAIVRATDYLDTRFRFVGRKLTGRDQTTEWPRLGAWDRDRYIVNGIPEEVKEACAEYALRALTVTLAPDPTQAASGATVESYTTPVDVISESYTFAAGGAFVMPKYPAADQKLIRTGLVRQSGEVIRG